MYYLPIKINNRRIHICRLAKEEENRTVFGFIISQVENCAQLQLLSIESNNAKLLSSYGYSKNVPLSHLAKSLSFDEESRKLTIHFDKKQSLVAPPDESAGPFVIKRRPYFTVLIDNSLMEYNQWKDIDFTIELIYDGFSYTFKIYYCAPESLKEAALDFGSEASQVRVSGINTNIRLVNLFKEITKNPANDFWQGIPDDPFFKSMFFVNKNPQRPICAADIPNRKGQSTFVQALVPKTANLSNLLILPNLKLLDMLTNDNRKNVMAQQIHFDGQYEDDIIANRITQTSSLSDDSVRKLVLEIVLDNFLHCVLKSIYVSNSISFFVRMIILMPNVYPQSKVYQVVEGLYDGFEKMKSTYPYCKGFEVQVLSESDASFLGARNTETWTIDGGGTEKLENKGNGYFFIIDAGKGTTDFSIMKQQADNDSLFDSVIRGGIPISGHYITYAFYEAVCEWLNSKRIPLNKLLKDAFENNRKALCDFVDLLDEFKKKYGKLDGDVGNLSVNMGKWDLDAVNEELKKQMGKKLPGIESKVNSYVDTIVKNIENEIAPFFESNGRRFTQVMFTGRGFLFKPLRDAMEQMLKDNGWMKKNANCLWRGGDQAKSVCMEGAFSVGKAASVNENTDLVGYPILRRKRTNRFLSKLYAWIDNNNVDSNFFYNGLTINQRQPVIRIGMDNYNLHTDGGEEKRLYFVGDDFIVQGKNEVSQLSRRVRATGSAGVGQSLFPFYEGSIPTTDNLPTQETTNPKSDNKPSETPLPFPSTSSPSTSQNSPKYGKSKSEPEEGLVF